MMQPPDKQSGITLTTYRPDDEKIFISYNVLLLADFGPWS